MSAWRAHAWLRRTARTVIVLVAGILIGIGWYHVDVQPGAQVAKTIFEAGPEVTPPSGFDAVRRQVRISPPLTVRVPAAPGAKVIVYAPHDASGLPVVFWIHGGGFISSSTSTVADFAVLLASKGYVVASLDYSLAPAARYPTPIDQGNAALDDLASRAAQYGGDPNRIFIGGDSAGAQLASELAAVQTTPTLAGDLALTPALADGQLRGAILYCGLYDMDTVGATGFPGLRTYLWAYTGHRDWTAAPFIDELSTTRQVTSAYPPTFITVGDADPLRTQGHELVSALEAQHVSTDTLFWDGTGDGLRHEYQFDYLLPQAQTALNRTISFLERNSGR